MTRFRLFPVALLFAGGYGFYRLAKGLELQAAAMAVVEDIGYGREVTDNVRGFVTVRIGSLRLAKIVPDVTEN